MVDITKLKQGDKVGLVAEIIKVADMPSQGRVVYLLAPIAFPCWCSQADLDVLNVKLVSENGGTSDELF